MKFENFFEDAGMDGQKSDEVYEFNVSARPVGSTAWRGRFNIPSQSLDIDIVAHISNKACLKVLDVVRTMPESLCLEMIPRLDVWPASFKSSPPTEHSVALFFFSVGRDEEVFDSLLAYAAYTDFALKAMIGEAELLVFTSLQLPGKLQRFQGKLYFWGVFKGQQAPSFNPREYHVQTQTPRGRQDLSPNSGNHRRFDDMGSPITISSNHHPSSDGAKAERRGRRLDNAWEHANALDVLRQKAECRYCGFISSHGGISRLKAHLGGGHPRIRLPGCDKVSPEVKKMMADWFSEWVKNTKALWTKEIRAKMAADVDESRRSHDVAREHAKPFSVDQKADSNYFGFNSLREEIPHLKVHLGGRDPKMHAEAWSKASFEVQGVISGSVKKATKMKGVMSGGGESLSASRIKKSPAGGGRGRPLDDAWEHAKPLDEPRQKTQCNYCGFVSAYGGISRLKAHLGGGSTEMQLQGCPNVSLEVKRVMEQWFNEWIKYSMATWTRKSHEIAACAKPSKRRRPLDDDTWEHAIPLDEMGHATRCKYCGFISKYGGIARLKAHLGGVDLKTQLESCPNVPPEVKSLMAKEVKRYMKKSKGIPMVLQETQRTSSEMLSFKNRHNIIRETLDGITNTSVKQRLQTLLESKSANLQEMHSEIQSLESQLAAMP